MDKDLLEISGKVDSLDIKELGQLLIMDNVDVSSYDIDDSNYLNADGGNIINLFFHDFNIYSFARDFVLSNLITFGYLKLNKVVQFFKKKNKYIGQLLIETRIITDRDTTVKLIFYFSDRDIEKIKIFVDSNKDKIALTIKRMKHNQTLEFLCFDGEVNMSLID